MVAGQLFLILNPAQCASSSSLGQHDYILTTTYFGRGATMELTSRCDMVRHHNLDHIGHPR